jgi:hypothetical protein
VNLPLYTRPYTPLLGAGMHSKILTAYRNAGYDPTTHYTTREVAAFFGFQSTEGLRGAWKDVELTPSAPSNLNTRGYYSFYSKEDIKAMASMYPYWNARRLAALEGTQTKINVVRRNSLTQIDAFAGTVETMPTITVNEGKDVEVPVPVAVKADSGMIEKRLMGYATAVGKFGIARSEAIELVKAGLFD